MRFAGIDIGNTAVKCAVFGSGGSLESRMPGGSLEDALALVAKSGVDHTAYCTTRSLTSAETKAIEEVGGWRLTADGVSLLKTDYSTPHTLGADRLAAAVGAAVLFPKETVLIADVGTALTLDVVDKDGTFKGGNISLGPEMRFRAMHEFTSRLPLAGWNESDNGDLLGHDTLSALQGGVKWGLVCEIAGMMRLAEERYGCRTLVLTGGYAPYLEADIREAAPNDMKIFYVPELVEFGLVEAYKTTL